MPEVSVGENSIGTQAWITAWTKPEALTRLQVPAAGLCISGRCRGLCPPPPPKPAHGVRARDGCQAGLSQPAVVDMCWVNTKAAR